MRPTLPIVVLLTLLATPAWADYSPPPVWDMLFASDIVAAGRITKLDQDTYTLHITDHIRGASGVGQDVTIKRKQDWTCAVRDMPYQVGQTVLVMANRDTKTPAHFRTRSAGFEGELFMKGADVLWPVHLFPWLRKTNQKFTSHGANRSIPRGAMALSTLATAMARVQGCHQITLQRTNPTGYRHSLQMKPTCSPRRHTTLSKDPLYQHLSKMLKDASK